MRTTTARVMGSGWIVDDVFDSRARDEETGDRIPDDYGVPHVCEHCGRQIQILVYLTRDGECVKVGEACARKIVDGYRRPARKTSAKVAPVVAAAPVAEDTYVPVEFFTESGDIDLLAMIRDIERHDTAAA